VLTPALGGKISKLVTSKSVIESRLPREAVAPKLKLKLKPKPHLALQPIEVPKKKLVTTLKPRTCDLTTDKPALKTAVRRPREVKPALGSAL
jgi:hypothetical protein